MKKGLSMQNIAKSVLAGMLILGLTACHNTPPETNTDGNEDTIDSTQEIIQLDDGLSAVRFEGDSGFDDFLRPGRCGIGW